VNIVSYEMNEKMKYLIIGLSAFVVIVILLMLVIRYKD